MVKTLELKLGEIAPKTILLLNTLQRLNWNLEYLKDNQELLPHALDDLIELANTSHTRAEELVQVAYQIVFLTIQTGTLKDSRHTKELEDFAGKSVNFIINLNVVCSELNMFKWFAVNKDFKDMEDDMEKIITNILTSITDTKKEIEKWTEKLGEGFHPEYYG